MNDIQWEELQAVLDAEEMRTGKRPTGPQLMRRLLDDYAGSGRREPDPASRTVPVAIADLGTVRDLHVANDPPDPSLDSANRAT